ncbi:hypothetical protein AWM68_09665 [Fictibacillus phosphorivorans]|uniref:Uncharacterized protein n=1 Tax=Fictibacillus phosphorivorans TaxID=1221500 RepID=A0A163QCG0_9BACL|nr:hypothetical protein AWM68_09665 [Fictibacillus phosphorivorans]
MPALFVFLKGYLRIQWLLLRVVDFHSRCFAFRGAGGEPHSIISFLSVSPVRLSRRSLAPSTTINRSEKKLKRFKSNNL